MQLFCNVIIPIADHQQQVVKVGLISRVQPVDDSIASCQAVISVSTEISQEAAKLLDQLWPWCCSDTWPLLAPSPQMKTLFNGSRYLRFTSPPYRNEHAKYTTIYTASHSVNLPHVDKQVSSGSGSQRRTCSCWHLAEDSRMSVGSSPPPLLSL